MTDQLCNKCRSPDPAGDQAPANYHAWLLRLWREHPDATWRITLQRTDGTRMGFPALEELFDYLLSLTHGERSKE